MAAGRAEILQIRSLFSTKGVVEAATFVLTDLATRRPSRIQLSEALANEAIFRFGKHLLDTDRYEDAATLFWGEEQFTTEPHSVRLIWNAIPQYSKFLCQGASAMGKSYTAAVWFLLDWMRDPEWTCVKVLSTSEEHARRNVFGCMKNLHASALVPLPGRSIDKSIQVNDNTKQGIHLVSIPGGDNGRGRLRGFHPAPRPPHPVFGQQSRVRALLDEAEEIPSGVWEGVDNMLSTADDVEHVKVFAATNPKDRNSKFGQYAEPQLGWETLELSSSEEWETKLGWHVIRLDAAKCENVIEQRTVYPGLQTYEGYVSYLKQGDTSPAYYTMARGWFPEQGVTIVIIPQHFLSKARGVFLFDGRVIHFTATDLAFGGGDHCITTIGKYGRVIGWQPVTGEPVFFAKASGENPVARWGMQIDQQVKILKTKTDQIALEIKRIGNTLAIPPELTAVDKTGSGVGVHDLLNAIWGPTVGIGFGEAATNLIIMEEDSRKACDLYDGIITEMHFATRAFLEFDYLKIAPSVNMDPVARQLTDRRFKQGRGERVRSESKDEYKARQVNRESPDYADSFCMAVQLVRMKTEFLAHMLATPGPSGVEPNQVHTVVDNLQFLAFD